MMRNQSIIVTVIAVVVVLVGMVSGALWNQQRLTVATATATFGTRDFTFKITSQRGLVYASARDSRGAVSERLFAVTLPKHARESSIPYVEEDSNGPPTIEIDQKVGLAQFEWGGARVDFNMSTQAFTTQIDRGG
jgi:hypothetical protein